MILGVAGLLLLCVAGAGFLNILGVLVVRCKPFFCGVLRGVGACLVVIEAPCPSSRCSDVKVNLQLSPKDIRQTKEHAHLLRPIIGSS